MTAKTLSRRRWTTQVAVALAVISACTDLALGGDPGPPRQPGATVLMVSLATVDRGRATDAVRRLVTTAVARGEVVAVYVVDGTAAGAEPIRLRDTGDPPTASNPVATERLRVERAERIAEDVDRALASTESPQVGTTVDLRDLVETGVRRAGALATGVATVVVVTSGFEARRVESRGSAVDRAAAVSTSDAADVDVVLLGVGDFGGVEERIDPTFVDRVIAGAHETCLTVAPRTCRVLPSLDANVTLLGEVGR